MPSRIVLIGCGGIGGWLLGPLVRYLASRPEPRPLLVLVDGDVFEARNLDRQSGAPGNLGTNKAEALAEIARAAGLAVQAVPESVTRATVGQLIREGDLVLLAVDNHPTRALVDRHLASLDEATLISGGNDETDGNVQLVRRRGGWSVDGHLVEIHPEIGRADADPDPGAAGCQALADERPQLLATNFLVAGAMFGCLWQLLERGSVPYSELYLDLVQGAMRSRSWFRLRPGEQ